MSRIACINLLPWRETVREQRKKEFGYWFLGVTAGLLVLAVSLNYIIDNWLEQQYKRNDFLKAQIAILDKHNAEIRNLKQQKDRLSQKMALIQSLQANRPLVVHMIDEIVNVLPAGVRLKRLDWNNRRIKIQGMAESNSYISTLMRHVEGSKWLSHPELIEIKSDKKPNITDQMFSLMVQLRHDEQDS